MPQFLVPHIMQNYSILLSSQVSLIKMVALPVPEFICKQCDHGYTTATFTRKYWQIVHKNVKKPKGTCYIQVLQIQPLSLHCDFIWYFIITLNTTFDLNSSIYTRPSSDNMTLLSSLQDDVFGLNNNDVAKINSNVILVFFFFFET